jgi:hypothetical protein
MIFKFGERDSIGNYKTIMIGTIFGKTMAPLKRKRKTWWVEWCQSKRTSRFREDKSTLEHILTLHNLNEQEVFVGGCLYS